MRADPFASLESLGDSWAPWWKGPPLDGFRRWGSLDGRLRYHAVQEERGALACTFGAPSLGDEWQAAELAQQAGLVGRRSAVRDAHSMDAFWDAATARLHEAGVGYLGAMERARAVLYGLHLGLGDSGGAGPVRDAWAAFSGRQDRTVGPRCAVPGLYAYDDWTAHGAVLQRLRDAGVPVSDEVERSLQLADVAREAAAAQARLGIAQARAARQLVDPNAGPRTTAKGHLLRYPFRFRGPSGWLVRLTAALTRHTFYGGAVAKAYRSGMDIEGGFVEGRPWRYIRDRGLRTYGDVAMRAPMAPVPQPAGTISAVVFDESRLDWSARELYEAMASVHSEALRSVTPKTVQNRVKDALGPGGPAAELLAELYEAHVLTATKSRDIDPPVEGRFAPVSLDLAPPVEARFAVPTGIGTARDLMSVAEAVAHRFALRGPWRPLVDRR